MAAKAPERRHPYLRQLAQDVFEQFVEFLEQAGADDVLDQMGRHGVIEDVMRYNPETVPRLLDTLWKLREQQAFVRYFRHVDTGEPVADADDPIGPCGRPWSDVKQSHLFATARVFLKKKEDDWALDKFVEEHGQEALDKLRSGDHSTVEQVRSVFKKTPTPDDYKEQYPGHGVYAALKPYLTSEAQFKLVPMFAEMTTIQIKSLEGILEQLTTPEALEQAASLVPDAIRAAMALAQGFAEAKVLHERRRDMPKHPNEREEFKRKIFDEARSGADKVLVDLILERLETLEKINSLKSANREAIHNLYPAFEDELWDVVEETEAVENAINCPTHIALVLKKGVRHIAPEVSQALDEFQNPDIPRDLMKIGLEEVGEDKLYGYLSNEACFSVWQGVAGKFNNQFNYQHDAKGDQKDLNNYEALSGMASSIWEDIEKAAK